MSSTSTVVLITGANSGIGYATSKILVSSSEQYHVIMAGRSRPKIENAASEIRNAAIKGSLSTLMLDVIDEGSIDSAVEKVNQEFGRVDVLINNAGVVSRHSNLKKEYEETLTTNVIGPVLVTTAFKPLLLKSQNPRILYVSSGLGSMTRATTKDDAAYNIAAEYDAYRVSKAALNMYMIQNEKELGKQGVKVWSLCPGLLRSNLRGTSEEMVNAGGAAGDPEDGGYLMLDMIEGRRDADIGKVVKPQGVWGW